MRSACCLLLLLLSLLLSSRTAAVQQGGAQSPASRETAAAEAKDLWTFDRYLNYSEITAHVRDLARRRPDLVRLQSMGKSIEGRDLWVLEITNRDSGKASDKPTVYLQGGIHGNEISSVMVPLYVAHKLVLDPKPGRSARRILDRNTLYIAPAVNPDAVHRFMTAPNSHWRPRFNLRPYDSDGDGKKDEDPYEDLNGDGEIGQMYRASESGRFVREADGKLRRLRAGEKTQKTRYEGLGREGIDNDGDGRYSEDKLGGVNLNRNFPVGFKAGKDIAGGHRGHEAASEPETRAIIAFVAARPNIALFLDYHNATKSLLYWLGPDGPAGDKKVYEEIAARGQKALGYALRPRTHAGAGLSIAWAYGTRGITSFVVELEPRREDGEEAGFMPARKFQHPELGEILLGNDHRKLTKRNPRPADIRWQCERNWKWVRDELRRMPRLAVRFPVFKPVEGGWICTGEVHNEGELPTDTEMAERQKLAAPITVTAEGAAGEVQLRRVAGGGFRPFRLRLEKKAGSGSEAVTLVVRHPRAGSVRVAVSRPRSPGRPIRKTYTLESGYATPAQAVTANNEFFKDGVPLQEKGPVFPLMHHKKALRVAVLLGEWRDFRHTIPAAEFEERFFSLGTYTGKTPVGTPAYGSVRDFYREMSYGQCEVTGKVFDWVELPGKYEDYRKLRFGTRVFSKALKKAVLEKHGEDALDDYDMWVFIWAGNAVRRGFGLWPVRLSRLKFARNKLLPVGVLGFKTGEFHNGQMAPLGVLCHELGHTFGMNDKYGLWAPPQPVANWCLMSIGEKGGEPSGRERPFHMCAWCKLVIGWVQPVAIDPQKPQKLALRPITHGPRECFRILLRPDGSEYLLLENRRREGFQQDLPSPGLAVFHIGPAPERPKAYVKRVRLLPAHGRPAPSRGTLAALTEVAWPQAGRTGFTVGNVRLENIRLQDDVVYFDVGPADR
ncbi:MAG: M14 family zinc carboxypeptidase [Planctomycetota bacterium]|jgi:M6 family metalloprotease-like protein